MKKLYFGIDCDPFCRNQQKFVDQVQTEILNNRPVTVASKCFGAWELRAETSREERDKIWNLMVKYYNDRLCRGAYCDDPWKDENKD